MAKDAFGNYEPGLQSAGVIGTSGLGFVGYGSGVPGAGTPLWYTMYVDLNTGTVYNNPDQTATGWQNILAGVTAVAGVTSYDGDPNGVKTLDGAGVCVGSGASLGSLWVTPDGTTWTQVLAV